MDVGSLLLRQNVSVGTEVDGLLGNGLVGVCQGKNKVRVQGRRIYVGVRGWSCQGNKKYGN